MAAQRQPGPSFGVVLHLGAEEVIVPPDQYDTMALIQHVREEVLREIADQRREFLAAVADIRKDGRDATTEARTAHTTLNTNLTTLSTALAAHAALAAHSGTMPILDDHEQRLRRAEGLLDQASGAQSFQRWLYPILAMLFVAAVGSLVTIVIGIANHHP
jgi:hypothetical protein